MNHRLSRRDFLKLAGLVQLNLAAPQLLRILDKSLTKPKNVIVIIFDALSAYDISLYGYSRRTTPNIDRLAERAVVYHNHFSAGNYTTPGTASLLTGVLPWTHRALTLNSKVIESYARKNVFNAFDDYYRIAYSHNGFANTFLRQFQNDLDALIPIQSLYLKTYDSLISALFKNDNDIASVSWVRGMKISEEGSAYSLFLSHLYESLQSRRIENLKPLFPRGLPTVDQVNPYVLETAIDTIGRRLAETPQPFIGYFHLMPPHHPYRTHRDFIDAFKKDGFEPIEKPVDVLAKRIKTEQALKRTEYDEFILYCDREFAKLYNYLESANLLEDTWVVLTSDHGEMFERGINGHGPKVLYQPVVRIPLVIFEPGRRTREDVYEYTSAVDVLPTLAHLTAHKIPDWGEGAILPPYATQGSNQSVYMVQALDNSPDAPLTQASVALVKEDYKLHYYFGYPEVSGGEQVKLFNIKSDPEELTDLYPSKKGIASELLNELKSKLAEADKPYS